MTLHNWRDYEKDLDARDRKRDFAHGCLVFAALIAIASLFGCSRDNTYSPETQNALALNAPQSCPGGSPSVSIEAVCKNGRSWGRIVVTQNLGGGTPVSCSVSACPELGVIGSVASHGWLSGSTYQWIVEIDWQNSNIEGVAANHWRGNLSTSYSYGGSTCGQSMGLFLSCGAPENAGGYITFPVIAGCNPPGGGGGGFEEQGKFSAHRMACPAFDGDGACECDLSGTTPQDWSDWAWRNYVSP